MKRLRFKNRDGVLYFGLGEKFKSSKMKYNRINKNIVTGMYNRGELEADLALECSNTFKIVDLVEKVIERKKSYLKYQSLRSYDGALKNKIIPFFDNKLVTEIKPIDIKKFHDTFVENGLGNGSINLSRVLLKEAFNDAILSELITVNPVIMVKMPKARVKKKKQMPCSLDEIDTILAKAKGSIKNFLGISFFTGMRSGELLALKWEDVDFDTDTISINKTMAKGVINSPKTHSSLRDIEMIPQAREFLKAQYLETGLKNGFLFLKLNGDYYSGNNFFAMGFKGILEEIGLPIRSLHNTRHTFASIMLNNGINSLWVSNTLGHESLDITLRVYTHYLPKKEKMHLEFLEKRYKTGTNDN